MTDVLLHILTAADLGPAVPEQLEHRICWEHGEPAAHQCDGPGCSAPLCGVCGVLNTDGERVCYACTLPHRCLEPGCPRRHETYSGHCRPHHYDWVKRIEARMARAKEQR